MVDTGVLRARGGIDMVNTVISNLQDGINPGDAVNLQQVESLIPSEFIKCNFSNSNTINSGSLTPLNTINTTPLIISDLSDFTIASNGITVIKSGLYRVTTSWYIDGSGTRQTPGIQFTLDGAAQPEIGALAYARNSNNNSETGNFLSCEYEINSNVVVGISSQQLGGGGTSTLIGVNSFISIQKIGDL